MNECCGHPTGRIRHRLGPWIGLSFPYQRESHHPREVTPRGMPLPVAGPTRGVAASTAYLAYRHLLPCVHAQPPVGVNPSACALSVGVLGRALTCVVPRSIHPAVQPSTWMDGRMGHPHTPATPIAYNPPHWPDYRLRHPPPSPTPPRDLYPPPRLIRPPSTTTLLYIYKSYIYVV